MKKILTTGLMAGALLASGCATTNLDPYTGQEKTSNATSGAIMGAIGGAAIGILTSSDSDRGKGALIGATSGALIGGVAGDMIDRQENELRRSLRATGIKVVRDGNKIHLITPGDITFQTAQSTIRPEFRPTLESIVHVLRRYDDYGVQVSGHADASGAHVPSMNMLLSENRAKSVKQFFVDYGIPSRRISATGYGYHKPIASNDTPEGRALNRRVEISIIN